jgi:four helix bundle protein
MARVKAFTDLEVYKLARQLAKEINKLTRSFPKEEMYSLTDQIRRSSRAVGAQIAEAWAKRRYKKHFVSKLTDSDGEQLETQHWILSALDSELWNDETAQKLIQNYLIVGRQLGAMMGRADDFCDLK